MRHTNLLSTLFLRASYVPSFAVIILAFIFLIDLPAGAQTPLTARPERGFGGQGGYQTTEIDSISLQNGSVSLEIPLASLPPVAGGKLGYALTARYNSKLWNLYRSEARKPQIEIGCPSSYATEYFGYADGPVGWTIGGTYEIFFRDANDDYDYIEPDNSQCYGYEWYHMSGRFFKPMLRMPDGSEHDLRIEGYYPTYGGDRDHLKGYYKYSGLPNQPMFTSPVRFYTTDGSFITIIYRPTPDPVRWTIYMKDGSRVESVDEGQRTIDPNGNSILQGSRMVGSIYESFVRDEYTGREIKWSGTTHNGQNATKVEYQSVGGIWQQVLAVWGTTTVQGKVTAATRWWVTEGQSLNDGPCYINQLVGEHQIGVIREIIFPLTEQGAQPRKFVFGYNSDTSSQASNNVVDSCYPYMPPYEYTRTVSKGWGEISDVTTPTGAHITYNYVHDNVHAFDPAEFSLEEPVKNFIKSKSITHDDQTDTWLYDISTLVSSNWPSSGGVTNPDGSAHLETYNPTNPAYGGYSGPDGSAGRLVRTVDSSGVLVERKWKALGGLMGAYGSNNQTALNPVVEAEFTTLLAEDGLTRLKMSAKKFEHDYNGEVTRVTEYDWFDPATVTYSLPGTWRAMPVDVPAGAQVLRVTNTAIHNYAVNAASNNAYHRRVPDPSAVILGKPYEITIGDGTTVKSTTRFSYDGLAFGVPPTKGNLTTTSAYNDVNSQWINSGTTYSTRGNPTSQTDGNGNVTQMTYGSINGVTDLYPTQTVVAYGTPTARTSSAVYDFYTGLATTATDVDNGISTVTEYDIIGRPTKVRNAAGTALESWTTSEYKDSSRTVVVRSDIEAMGDGRKVEIQHYDRLGRVRLSRTLENAATENPYDEQHGIKVEKRYGYNDPTPSIPNDPASTLGSYTLVSNPFRAATAAGAGSEQTMGWTLTYAQNNARHSETTTYAGATLPAAFGGGNTNSTGVVKTDVVADRTLVTDPAGKQKISRTNAIGQLKDVWEITGQDSATEAVTFPGYPGIGYGYKTTYGYDVLSNLTAVSQGVQARTYTYSSLSRLLTATNPEQGSTPSNGTITYQYDNNGNLTRKTDPRGVQTDYVYDQLNRITNRNYSTPGGTPSNYQASPNATFTYDNLAHAKGKLTKVSTGTGVGTSTTEYTQFDILGRVAASKQTTDGVAYGNGSTDSLMTYTYNLAGALIEQQYPSGRKVRNVLDSSGALSLVLSRKNSGIGSWTYANAFAYNTSGAVTSMRLGNGRWESTQFNARLQPTQIALGTVQNGHDKLKLNYEYGALNPDTGQTISGTNNGSVSKQIIKVLAVGSTPGFEATQYYTYDPLNRLQIATENILPDGQPLELAWRQHFQYDRYGNRNFVTTGPAPTTTIGSCPAEVCNPAVSGTNNRITSTGYGYDTAGNTIADPHGRSFIYDSENKQAKVLDNQQQAMGEYSYDADGKRIKKYVPATAETTIFVYDALGKMVAEYSTTVASAQDAKVAYLTNDNLGSPRINTDARSDVKARHDYHPFGEEINSIVTTRRSSGVGYVDDAVRKQFTGYERDDEIDLDFAQARYYSNRHGRFTTPDDFSNDSDLNDPQSWGKYVYVRNRPTTLTDPTGQCTPTPGNPCVKAPVITGPNKVPNQPNREQLPNIGQLGFKDASLGGHVLMNVESQFAAGDKISDYKTLRTAVLPGGVVRNGSEENPVSSQIEVDGNSKFVTDSPGLRTEVTNPRTGETQMSPKATLEGNRFTAAFVSGEYNTKTKTLGSNVSYYFVEIAYGKNGTIDQAKSRVVPMTRDEFIKAVKAAGVKIPKNKKKEEDPELLLTN